MNRPFEMIKTNMHILAEMAGLEISDERAELVGSQLSVWLRDANKLSRKMSQLEYLLIVPMVIFHHPDIKGGDES
jgi:hypothetical protein